MSNPLFSIPINASCDALIINSAEPYEVFSWIGGGEVILIDVRETAEYQIKYILGFLLYRFEYLSQDYFHHSMETP